MQIHYLVKHILRGYFFFWCVPYSVKLDRWSPGQFRNSKLQCNVQTWRFNAWLTNQSYCLKKKRYVFLHNVCCYVVLPLILWHKSLCCMSSRLHLPQHPVLDDNCPETFPSQPTFRRFERALCLIWPLQWCVTRQLMDRAAVDLPVCFWILWQFWPPVQPVTVTAMG